MMTTVRVFLPLMLCLMARSLIRTATIRRSRTLVSTKAAVADNAGIRRLPSVHPSLLALWKVSNVAVFEGSALYRAASEPVSVWLKHNQHQHSNNIPTTILFPSTLAASISGIVLVAESDINVARLTRVVYVGVLACPVADAVHLQEKLTMSITNALNNNHDKASQKETAAITSTDQPPRSVPDLEVDVEVMQSSESGTHNGLHLVRVSLIGSPTLTLSSPIPPQVPGPSVTSPSQQDTTSIVERLLVGCAVAKAPCVMDGKTPLLSLVGIEAQIESTTHTHSNSPLNPSTSPSLSPGLSSSPHSSLSPSPGPVTVAVAQEVPVKFTKYMRRENILHTRLTTSHRQEQKDDTTRTAVSMTTAAATSTTTATTTDMEPIATTATTATATEATFMGLSLVVPADALRPRPSR